jgi:hypothetical protein
MHRPWETLHGNALIPASPPVNLNVNERLNQLGSFGAELIAPSEVSKLPGPEMGSQPSGPVLMAAQNNISITPMPRRAIRRRTALLGESREEMRARLQPQPSLTSPPRIALGTRMLRSTAGYGTGIPTMPTSCPMNGRRSLRCSVLRSRSWSRPCSPRRRRNSL